jgi:hypothetical protein
MTIVKSDCTFRNLINMAIVDSTTNIGTEKNAKSQIKELENMIGHLIENAGELIDESAKVEMLENIAGHLVQNVLTDKQLVQVAYRDKKLTKLTNWSQPLMRGYTGDMFTYSTKLFNNLTNDEKLHEILSSNYLEVNAIEGKNQFRAYFKRIDKDNKNILIVKEFDDEWEEVGQELKIDLESIYGIGY